MVCANRIPPDQRLFAGAAVHPRPGFTGGDNARVGGYPGQRVDAGQAFHFGDVGGIQIEFHSVFLNA
jgi:hypothetical protein